MFFGLRAPFAAVSKYRASSRSSARHPASYGLTVVLLQRNARVSLLAIPERGRALPPPALRFHRHQIRIGKISIIVRGFLCPHEKCLARGIVPAARLLFQFFAAFQRLDLSLESRKPARAAHR